MQEYGFALNSYALIGIGLALFAVLVLMRMLIRGKLSVSKEDGIRFGMITDVEKFTALCDDVKKIKEDFTGVKRDILRLNLISTENDIVARIDAGKRYTDDGGNGPAQILYEKLKAEYEKSISLKVAAM
jgi:hypothetical protein